MATLKSQRSGATVVALVVLSLALGASVGVNFWLALHHVSVTQLVIVPPSAVKQEPEVYHDSKNFGEPGQFCETIWNHCTHGT